MHKRLIKEFLNLRFITSFFPKMVARQFDTRHYR